MSPEISIVIPCLNERDNVIKLIDRLIEILPETSVSAEVIFADGGSTDGTHEALEAVIKAHGLPNVRLLEPATGGGYGGDILRGLAQARGAALAWTHADLQTDLLDVFTAYRAFVANGGQAFVKGKRRNRAWLEAFMTFGMQIVVFAALRTYLSDINAQPKVFSRDFYERHLRKDAPTDFSLDLYAYYQAKNCRLPIITIPVIFAKRQHGEAKGGGGSWKNRFKLIRRTNRYIWQLSAEMKVRGRK